MMPFIVVILEAAELWRSRDSSIFAHLRLPFKVPRSAALACIHLPQKRRQDRLQPHDDTPIKRAVIDKREDRLWVPVREPRERPLCVLAICPRCI
jgi:hypothetical protein